MCSFIRDERGVTEPYTDLPALGIVAVGLIIFCYLMLSAYSAYASSAYYAAVKGDLGSMARSMACDSMFTDGRPGMLDARKLDNASKNDGIFSYGYPGSSVLATVECTGHKWELGSRSAGKSASSRVPITVVLNDARCIPGTLTVTMWER